MQFSNARKRDCARRELAQRRRVYPRLVDTLRMKGAEAANEIAIMEAIAEDYARLAEEDAKKDRLL